MAKAASSRAGEQTAIESDIEGARSLAESGQPTAIEWDEDFSSASATSAVAASTSIDDVRAAKQELLRRLGGTAMIAAAVSASEGEPMTSAQTSGLENITGVGISCDGCVVVLVERLRSRGNTSVVSQIPEDIEGVPVQMLETGPIFSQSAFQYGGRYPRPVPCGTSCGNARVLAGGTIGALVILEDHRLAFLSNNHVIGHVYENARPGTPRGNIGDAIRNPGLPVLSNFDSDNIGRLAGVVPIRIGHSKNRVDAAVAITSSQLVKPQHLTYTMPARPQPIRANGNLVMKDGVRTGTTRGQLEVSEIENLSVSYGPNGLYGTAFFDNQLLIRSRDPFLLPGDSGSLIVTQGSRLPVGLGFASSLDGTQAFANPIDEVMKALKIRRIIGDEQAPYPL